MWKVVDTTFSRSSPRKDNPLAFVHSSEVAESAVEYIDRDLVAFEAFDAVGDGARDVDFWMLDTAFFSVCWWDAVSFSLCWDAAFFSLCWCAASISICWSAESNMLKCKVHIP